MILKITIEKNLIEQLRKLKKERYGEDSDTKIRNSFYLSQIILEQEYTKEVIENGLNIFKSYPAEVKKATTLNFNSNAHAVLKKLSETLDYSMADIIRSIITLKNESIFNVQASGKFELLRNVSGDYWSNDPDDTKTAREFYEKYFFDILNSNISLFRGETILTFSTIAGCIIRTLNIYKESNYTLTTNKERRLEIILKSDSISTELKEDIQRFYNIYHSKSNFMVFPKLKKEKNEPYLKPEESPYLQFCKNHDFNEFPDLFLRSIRNYYLAKPKSNVKFTQNINKAYFGFFGNGEEGWHNFVEKNFLQDFFNDDKYEDFIQLSPKKSVRIPYTSALAKKLSETDKQATVDEVHIFIKNALIILENRAIRLSNFKSTREEK